MKKQRKNKNKKNFSVLSIVFFVLFLFVYSLSIGYSLFTQNLSINGRGVVRADLDVRITDIRVASTTNGGLVNSTPRYLATSPTTSTISSDVTLPNSNSTVTYEVEVTNLSALNVVVTQIQQLNSNNNNIEYSISNLTVNKTKISNASTYKFNVTMKYKNGASVSNNTCINTLEFTFYKLPRYNYSINVNPSDVSINLNIDGVDSVITGSYSGVFDENTVISYSIKKYGYKKVTGSDTLRSDVNKNITLEKSPEYKLTVNVNPSFGIANVTCEGQPIATVTNGTGTFNVYAEEVYTISSTAFEYYEKTEDYTMPNSDSTYNVTLTEWPGFTDQKTNSDRDKAAEGTITVTRTGYYLVELWGGIGGRDYQEKSSRSNPGYIYATVKLNANQQVYYSLGGNGEDGKALIAAKGGANGGADAPAIYPGGGGGYSAIAINTQTINEANINNGNVLMIAGGGGGSGSGYLPSSKPSYGPGGNGGTLSSTSTTNSIGYVYYGTNGSGADSRTGAGGTTTGGAGAANKNNKYAESGSILKGGKANTNGSWTNGGSGGAGYYGGGGGAGEGKPSDGSGSGGGGSSLISTILGLCTPGNTYNASLLGTNPSSTGGAVKITFVHR